MLNDSKRKRKTWDKKEGKSQGNWKSTREQSFLNTEGQLYVYVCIHVYVA